MYLELAGFLVTLYFDSHIRPSTNYE